jgi:hypothetical protein
MLLLYENDVCLEHFLPITMPLYFSHKVSTIILMDTFILTGAYLAL